MCVSTYHNRIVCGVSYTLLVCNRVVMRFRQRGASIMSVITVSHVLEHTVGNLYISEYNLYVEVLTTTE